MTSIFYVGMDVHTTNYTLCCYSVATDKIFATATLQPDYMKVVKYLAQLNQNHGGDVHFQCGYEAGTLGYSLYHQLTRQGIDCVILAPSTMATTRKKGAIKNDKRDAANIAKCLAYNTYSAVYVPDDEDNAVKEYIRMRNDAKDALKERQAGNDPKVIAYADRANERLKRKCYRIMFKSKRNIAVTAIARELACFIWGMMTDNVA
jgi:transposase